VQEEPIRVQEELVWKNACNQELGPSMTHMEECMQPRTWSINDPHGRMHATKNLVH